MEDSQVDFVYSSLFETKDKLRLCILSIFRLAIGATDNRASEKVITFNFGVNVLCVL